jgi:hypothetical protein
MRSRQVFTRIFGESITLIEISDSNWPRPVFDLWHKRAIPFEPLCANMGFFATSPRCFRAGLVLGKCLISKWDSEENVIPVPLTLNQQVEGSIPSAVTTLFNDLH